MRTVTASPLLPLRAAAALTLAALGSACAAAVSDEDELAGLYGDKGIVSIASGAAQPLRRAPAVATAITAEDIRATGATDLNEVLETVPGLHVGRSYSAYAPLYTFRGIVSPTFNPQVLMLINGIPATTAYTGDRGLLWAGLPLDNVSRIEVIRGPGSALYGADAFAGVINIVTKSAADIQGTQVGLRLGSFDRRDAWVLHGGRWGGVEVAAYFAAGHTDGARPLITRDAQSGFDAIFAGSGVAPVSLAPGPINIGYSSVDGGLELGLGKWRARLGFRQRTHIGSGAGGAQALDPSNDDASRDITSDLSYQHPNVAPGWDLSALASTMHYRSRPNIVAFPAGTNIGSGFFQDGLIGNPWLSERHVRISASAVYSGFDTHRLRLGAGHEREEIYKIRETKNFNPDFSPIGSGSLADVIDVSDTLPYVRPHTRHVAYAYLQDEWKLGADWALTAGVRYDHYSGFGGTTNPRLALVWDAAFDVTAKLLYGTAFRAPAFAELYAINNPVVIGNPALEPEKMETQEAAITWQASDKLQIGVNVFRYRLTGLIHQDSTLTFANGGRQDGHGLELEAAWDVSRRLRLTGNYGGQRSTESAGRDPGLAPRHHVNLRADWRLSTGWLANAQLNWVGARVREPDDVRPPVPNYAVLDLTLRKERSRGQWEFALSLRNLLNADAREPSPNGAPFVAIPNDLPLAGRAVVVEASYKL